MEDHFSNEIAKIPLSNSQKDAKRFQDLAAGKRLDKYGDFATLDNLVKAYSGAYNHDDFYNMEVSLVYNMILINKESHYIDARAQELQRQLTKKP